MFQRTRYDLQEINCLSPFSRYYIINKGLQYRIFDITVKLFDRYITPHIMLMKRTHLLHTSCSQLIYLFFPKFICRLGDRILIF